MASKPVTPDSIAPFAPPRPADLERDEAKAAREAAEALRRSGTAQSPVGYAVRHDLVGPWSAGERPAAGAVRDHFRGHPQTDAFVERLVALGALAPFFE